MLKKYRKADVDCFLMESNAIEGVYSKEALEDAKKAWKFLLTVKELDTDVVLQVHKLLMQNLHPEIAGQLRHCTVYIGRQIKPFISHALLRQEVDVFCKDVNYSLSFEQKIRSDMGPEVLCRASHVDFEDIHPFQDGNGRTGRLLMNWQRWMMGLPILIIHEGEEQFSYYKWFKD